jgi:hypothetical protein
LEAIRTLSRATGYQQTTQGDNKRVERYNRIHKMHREGELGRRKTKRSYKKLPHFQDSIRFYTESFGKLQILLKYRK